MTLDFTNLYKKCTAKPYSLFIYLFTYSLFTYSSLEKSLENKNNWTYSWKTNKRIEGKVQKQLLDTEEKSITSLFSKDFFSQEAAYELNKIKEIQQKINRDNSIYKTDHKKRDKTSFSKVSNNRNFKRKVYGSIFTLDNAPEKQIKLQNAIGKFKESTKLKVIEKKRKTNY